MKVLKIWCSNLAVEAPKKRVCHLTDDLLNVSIFENVYKCILSR